MTTCVASSLAAGEPLAGTAVERVTTWVLVEVPGAWGKKGVDDTPMPEALRMQLMTLGATPGVRPQLIRRPGGAEGALTALVVRSGPVERLETLVAPDVDALAAVDLAAWARGELPTGAEVRDRAPLVLVCTHGKRDRCCAEHGVALHAALAQALPETAVWQSTHLNGHRFAATAIVFPGGWQYGRLDADDAGGLAQAIRAGHLYRLDRLRGRTNASAAEQVAELAWRHEHHALDLAAPTIALEDGVATVNGTRWTVSARPSPTPLVQSCGTDAVTPPRWAAARLASAA